MTLDQCEREIVKCVAEFRFNRVNREHLGRGKGESGNTMQRHLQGALGEIIVAKTYGWYWAGDCESWNKGDFGEFEVRATTHAYGNLIVYPNDTDEKKCLLVVVDCENYSGHVVGWCHAGLAKRDEFKPPVGKLRAGSPAQWWVPQRFLNTCLVMR